MGNLRAACLGDRGPSGLTEEAGWTQGHPFLAPAHRQKGRATKGHN